MAKVKLESLSKLFGEVKAVDNIDLTVKDGEFLTLVGPSGCGKSTTLRLIAGLEKITKGNIFIDKRLINELPPHKRNISMVFQSYALFPHMSVEANIGFGLKIKKLSRDNKRKKIGWALELLRLEGLENRLPRELSGGQRQRVALGRALVLEPDVLLLDEPLSNLDAKLRLRMRTELKRLHKKVKTTIIYVTHDQAEAMTLSDRLAVMKDGKILQLGTPEEVYKEPQNLFTAGFIGSPSMNFLPGEIIPFVKDEKAIVGVRPEDLKLSSREVPDSLRGKSSVTESLGSDNYLYVEVSDTLVSVRLKPEEKAGEGEEVWLVFDSRRVHKFDKNTSKRI